MSHAKNPFTGRCKLLLFGVSPITKTELAPLITRYFPLSSSVHLPKTPSAEQMTCAFEGPMPKVCVLQIEDPRDPTLDLIPQLVQFDPKLPILAIAPADQSDLILRCLRLGATDILVSPFTAEQAGPALDKVINLLPSPKDAASPAKTYCVIPAKGACGATTLACNLSYQYKRLGAGRVLLADLDPLTGVVAFILKVTSEFSFADVLHRTADMDADLWKAMVTPRDHVDILLAPENLADVAGESSDASPILDYARYNYDVVIADAGRAYGEWTLSQAQVSDEVLLVTTNELASLQAAQRALSYLENNGIGRWKIRLIVNRYDPRLGLNQEAISDALHLKVYHVLPSDYATVHQSLLEGRPVPASSGLGKSIAELAQRLSGREPVARKTSSFSGLLALFSRTSG